MKITILTYGSRGDVQPFLPLSLRLREVGHSVKLAAPFRFKELVDEYRIDFVPLSGDPEQLSRRLNNAGHNFVKLLRELTNHAIEIGADIWHQTEKACKDADLILHTFTHTVGAHTLAREMRIPDVHTDWRLPERHAARFEITPLESPHPYTFREDHMVDISNGICTCSSPRRTPASKTILAL